MLSEGTYGDGDVRLRYTFEEHRILLRLVPATDPTRECTMWIGNFDALGPPCHNGTHKVPHEPIVGDLFFFPHPVNRQGLLLTLPPQTPLFYRGTALEFKRKAGQDAALQFAMPEVMPEAKARPEIIPGRRSNHACVQQLDPA